MFEVKAPAKTLITTTTHMLNISFVSAQVKNNLRPIFRLLLSSKNQHTWNPLSKKFVILDPSNINSAQTLEAGRCKQHILRKLSIRFKQNKICPLANSNLWRHEHCIYSLYIYIYIFIGFCNRIPMQLYHHNMHTTESHLNKYI